MCTSNDLSAQQVVVTADPDLAGAEDESVPSGPSSRRRFETFGLEKKITSHVGNLP